MPYHSPLTVRITLTGFCVVFLSLSVEMLRYLKMYCDTFRIHHSVIHSTKR